MLTKEFERLERTKTNVFSETAARAQMQERDPGVLRVPDDRRNGAECKEPNQGVQTRSFEFLPKARHKSKHKQHRDDLECVRVSAKKSETNEQPGQRPVK